MIAGNVQFKARAAAPQLTGSTSDDQATLSLPAKASSGLSLSIVRNDYPEEYCTACAAVRVMLTNQGPSDATSTTAAPVRLTFAPAAGVSAVPATVALEYVGSLPVGQTVALGSFSVARPITPTAVLGTVHVDPGTNRLTGPADFPVTTSDLSLRLRRDSGITLAGAPGNFTLDVTNRGSATEQDVVVRLQPQVIFSFTPSVGAVEPYPLFAGDFVWRIPSLAAGETVTLTGNAPHPSSDAILSATAFARAFEFNTYDNDFWLDFAAAPLGTADMRVTSVQVSTDATTKRATITAKVENAGPFAAVQSPADPISVQALAYLGGIRPISAEALSSGWSCTAVSCSPLETLAPGASASLRFVIDATYPSELPQVGALVRSVTTPDSEPSNNNLQVPYAP